MPNCSPCSAGSTPCGHCSSCCAAAAESPSTPRLLEKSLGLSREQALTILEGFARFKLVSSEEAELDDTVQTIYDFRPNPALLALLAIGKEIIQKPGSFNFNCVSRNRPYFVGG
jgi:hypothetical protein